MNRRPTKLPSREKLRGKNKMLKRLAQGKSAHLLRELQIHQAELEMQNEALRESRVELEKIGSRYSDLYHFAPVGYFILDHNGIVLEVNSTGEGQLGMERRTMIGTPFTSYVAPEDHIRFHTHLAAVLQDGARRRCEINMAGRSAPFYAQLESLLVEEKGGALRCRTVVTDITARKRADEEIEKLNESLQGQILLQTAELRAANQALENEVIERMRAEQVLARRANLDALTGLYSRRYFDVRAEEEIARADRKGESFAILLCDLDYFKSVVHTLGHQTGDRVLKAVAQKILACIRETDLVFRWKGNEIAMLLTDTSRRGVLLTAERIQKAVAKVSEEAQILLQVRIGAALYPEHGFTIDALIRLAEHSLSVAKRGAEKLYIGHWEQRIDPRDVRTVFQPVIDLRSNHPIGYEALTRDPQGKLTAPELFKRYQTMGRLNELKQLCFLSQIHAAQRLGLEGRRLFLNVDFDLLEQLSFFQKPDGIDVILEISEREASQGPHVERHLALAEKWRARGFQIALDDFGAGSVSFPFIGKLVPDYIKLDRCTLLQAISSPKVRGFLNDLVLAFRNYTTRGMIAEGIETEAELAVVREMGVELGQGFMFGRPEALMSA